MKIKILRTGILLSVLVFAGILWFTREVPLISQSAFALSPNKHWYILMHLAIMLTFVLDAVFGRRGFGWLVVLGSAGTLAFNMYDFPLTHNIFTAFTMASAVFNLIFYATPKTRPYAILTSFVGSLVFIIGLSSNLHIFFAEIVAEFCIGVGMARRIWIKR
ncbi:hypothetical protein PANI_CDS0066 [Maribacter phage Panino]